MTQLSQITSVSPSLLDAEELLTFWNAAQPDDLATSSRLFAWWQSAHNGIPALQQWHAEGSALLLRRDSQLLGAALVSAPLLHGEATEAEPPSRLGRLDGIAVPAGRYRSTHRAKLIAAAEEWLRAAGATAITLGGGPFSLFRGMPGDPRTARALRDLGYTDGAATPIHDLAVDVARYKPPADEVPLAAVARPAQPGDRAEVEALLKTTLQVASTGDSAQPGDLWSIHQLLAQGRISDLMLLWTADGLAGIAQIAFADSTWPVELCYPWTLPRPWAALPLVMIRHDQPDAACLALIGSSLRRLHNTGVNSCVAPGIARTSLYEGAGFALLRSWEPFVKRL